MKKIAFIIVSIIVLAFAKVKAQVNKSIRVYNNTYINSNLFLYDTIYAQDYNLNEGLILYYRSESDTLFFKQTEKNNAKPPASLITWKKDEMNPKYKNSNVLLKTRRKLPWSTIDNWGDSFHSDHASHYSHYSGM